MGRDGEALACAEEALGLYRAMTTKNPRYMPGLAQALYNLGVILNKLDRYDEALAPMEEAVGLYRDAAADIPGYLPDLADALDVFGETLANLGRHVDALKATEEAVRLYRDSASEDVGSLPRFAGALNYLGLRLASLGRHAEALPPTEEAVGLYRYIAADNPDRLPELAQALNNLGIRFSNLGRHAEALPPTEAAVDLYLGIAADKPDPLPDLAKTLTHLGSRLANLGHHDEALTPAKEAVRLYRVVAAQSAGNLRGLAEALDRLGEHLANLGLYSEALEVSKEAVGLYRSLAAADARDLLDLGALLNNLGVRLAHSGRLTEALQPTEEAIDLYRSVSGDDPGRLSSLARALTNLGIWLGNLGRLRDAQGPAEEAVQLCMTLATSNNFYLEDLAFAVTRLERILSEIADASPMESIWDIVKLRQPIEDLWQRVLSAFSPNEQAALLLYCTGESGDHDPRATDWLAKAASLAVDYSLTVAIRDEVRRRRRLSAAFDYEWQMRTETPVPDWARIDLTTLATVREWMATPTHTAEAAFLAAHPDLLNAKADAAMTEAMLGLPDDEVARYLQLRRRARIVGVKAAYRRLTGDELAAEFANADAARQRELLKTRRDDLYETSVLIALRSAADQFDSRRIDGALALLALAADTGSSASIDELFDAIQDDAELSNLLTRIAIGGDLAALTNIATYGLSRAASETGDATCSLFLGAAALLSDDPEDGTAWITNAYQQTPDARDDWIALAVQIGAAQPKVLKAISLLTQARLFEEEQP